MEPPGPSRSRTADAARVAIPLLIVFAAPSSLVVERDRPSQFPILGNGPPGTFVLFPGRLRVSLPTDQVVSADDTGGYAKVGFGGMRFTGMASGRLVFVRERDLYPVDQLSPDRSHTMRLEPQWVASVFATPVVRSGFCWRIDLLLMVTTGVPSRLVGHRPASGFMAERAEAHLQRALSTASSYRMPAFLRQRSLPDGANILTTLRRRPNIFGARWLVGFK